MKTMILTLILVFFATLAHADFAEDLQNGNKFYAEKNYEKAKTEYEKVCFPATNRLLYITI